MRIIYGGDTDVATGPVGTGTAILTAHAPAPTGGTTVLRAGGVGIPESGPLPAWPPPGGGGLPPAAAFTSVPIPVPTTIGGITLEVTKLIEWSNVPVYDGPTYLYNRHRIIVEATLNPAVNPYEPGQWPQPIFPRSGVGVTPPLASDGGPSGAGAVTWRAIWHFLSQPRRALIVMQEQGVHAFGGPRVDDYVVFRSPLITVSGASYGVDAVDGPKPFMVSPVNIRGTKTWTIRFGVETCVNYCKVYPGSTTTAGLLLSHRFTSTEDLDQDFYATRTITGRGIFRMDRVKFLDITVDDLRRDLFHAIPLNFRRSRVRVQVNPTGNEFHYTIVDREQPVNLVALGVSRIECWHSVGQTMMSDIQIAMNIAGSAWAAMRSRSLRGVGTMLERSIPHQRTRIVVKVWGTRKGRRQNLARVAMAIIAKRVAAVGAGTALWGEDIEREDDVMGKFVQISASYVSNPVGVVILAGTGGLAQLNDRMPATDDVITDGGLVATTADAYNPSPPSDFETRGHYLGTLIARALETPCQVLAGPFGSAFATDVNPIPTLDD